MARLYVAGSPPHIFLKYFSFLSRPLGNHIHCKTTYTDELCLDASLAEFTTSAPPQSSSPIPEGRPAWLSQDLNMSIAY